MTAVSLKRYSLVYLASIAGLVALSFALEYLFGNSLPSGLSTVLPTFIAAMTEGQKAAEADAPEFTGPQAWAQARRMTGVVIAINCVIFLIMMFVPEIRALFVSMPLILGAVLVALFAVTFLVNRFALTQGYRAYQKAKAKREARGK